MDLDKHSVWGSLKQKTRPFLQTLSVRKTKKRSGKMLERKGRSLDRCLSVSVPDMLQVETLMEEEEEEETTYSSAQVLSSCSPKSFSRSVVSLKSRNTAVKAVGEDWLWASQQDTRMEVTVTTPEAVGIHLASPGEAVGSPVSEGKRKPSEDLLDLLQRSRLSSEGTEVGAGEAARLMATSWGLLVLLLNFVGYKGEEDPSKARLDGALSSLVWQEVSSPWNEMSFKILSHLNHSVTSRLSSRNE